MVPPEDAYTVFVLGASGDLAKKKVYPSLYELYLSELLPTRILIVGYARSSIADDAFRASIRAFLTAGTDAQRDGFLALCIYRAGGYDDAAAFRKAATEVEGRETALTASGRVHRMFYFAIPPTVFVASAATVHAAGKTTRGWNRVVVEKPFGMDSASSAALGEAISSYFPEREVYRIDHYLGKEMVQNLMVLRFGNIIFEPLWNRNHIASVQITFKEPFGTEGRGGYFDDFGIIRDVMQNHLTQVMSLVAMETPVSSSAEDVRDEKVKVLKCVSVVQPADVVLGQYGPNAAGTKKGYLDDATVPAGSRTPTFAAAVLHVNNPRWAGVPFILKCGKALNDRKAEIRVQFKAPPNALFTGVAAAGDGGGADAQRGVGQERGVGQGAAAPVVHQNELVIRIQPNEAIYMKLMSRLPGMAFVPVETELALSYQSRFPARPVPDAYSRLLLDVFRGDQSQFVRADELVASWAIFTPLLRAISGGALPVVVYPYGSRGPPQADVLIARAGYVWEGHYSGEWRRSNDPAAGALALRAMRDEFTLSTARLQQLVGAFLEEMAHGLAGEPSTIKMIPSHVTALPTGGEVGSSWAIDLGGSNLRVIEVELRAGGAATVVREHKAVVPAEVQAAHGDVLFDFIAAACASAGMPAGARLGFTFSFPYAQTAINAGVLLEWTKGFTNAGVVGTCVVAALEAAFARAGLAVKVAALANDTVGTLCAGAFADPRTRVGVILGTGTNAAYIERVSRIGKWRGAPPASGAMLINMEWGGFGSGGASHAFSVLPFHAVDHELDHASPNQTKQRFEKMMGGMYLGELARLLLVQAVTAGALLAHSPTHAHPATSAALFRPGGFSTAQMSEVGGDESPALDATAAVLAACTGAPAEGIAVEDRRVVAEICSLVARRAARLAAAGIAGVITQIAHGSAAAGAENCSVGIDGSVFSKYPHFKEWMEAALVELGVPCKLFSTADGSGVGAALIAVVASTA